MLAERSNGSVAELIAERQGIRLDIGCGQVKQGEDWIGIDARPLPGVDIVWDVEDFPWPLPDECALVAVSSHLIEHINPHKGVFMRFMDEVWRVLRPGGQFAIVTPHGYSPGYLQDPTHCNPCSEATFAYFDPEETVGNGVLWGIYKPKPWKILSMTWSPAVNIEVVLAKRAIEERWYA